jgi:heme/copper-type cytochrome/quinol oxidase subunit 2
MQSKQESHLSGIIDYFSAPNLIDTFKGYGDFNVNLHYLNPSILSDLKLWDISHVNNFLNYKDLSSNQELFLTNYVNEIVLITPEYNNISTLTEFFPESTQHFENFELSALEPDEGVFEALSTPDLKIFYPEPFIASPSFVHEDLWFLHILHFQHWLWFFFISLIMFFFISFVNVVRWCNLRNKPKRETRGVSRSKCADLITACVPVSWATAIIITETVDAADYYDGFGTGEIVIGIRAYQWGWEYFYPKSIDLNYSVNPSYSAVVGNSLKYFNSSSNSLKSNTLWKYHQNNKNSNNSSTPAHIILTPTDKSNLINFMNLDDIGVSTLKDSTSFKKIQFFSKTNPTNLFNVKSDFQNSFNKLNSLYLNDLDLTQSYTYGMDRQHTYTSLSSVLPNFSTLVDTKSVNKFVNYTLGYNNCNNNSLLSINRFDYENPNNTSGKLETSIDNLNTLLKLQPSTGNVNAADFSSFIKIPNFASVLSAENDSKQYSNAFKFLLNSKYKKKSIQNYNSLLNTNTNLLLSSNEPHSTFSSSLYNTENNLKFKDYKSSNAQFLGSERTVRLLNNISSNSYKWNLSASPNVASLIGNNLANYGNSQNDLYSKSMSHWSDDSKYNRFANSNVYMPSSNAPIMSNNPFFSNTSFDFYEKGKDDSTPMVLRSKEESAPNHVFNTYWSSYWAMSNLVNRFESINNTNNLFQNFYFPFFTEYAEYDFRNWASIELMEDSFWESSYNSSLQDEYFNVKQSLTSPEFFKKQELIYNTALRSVKDAKLKSGLMSKTFLSDTNQNTKNLYSLPIFSEESINNPKFTSLKDFVTFPNELSIEGLDEAYESSKYINYLYHLNFKNLINQSTNNIQPLSYATVFDSFRSDYEDPFLYSDSGLSATESTILSEEVDNNNNLKLSNPFKLRSTVKNAIVTYNAIQKVFRSRFDEGRSNARLEDFSNSFVKHPYITDSRINYESLLGKNKEAFLKTNLYTQAQKLNYSYLSSIFFTNNIYFMDLPFLVSMKSDPSRYLWFDWQSRWSSMEVSASSVSRYSLLGLPYSNKSFEYFTGLGDDLNDSETYLTKLGKARKNYGSNWAFTPYFFSRVSNWYSQDTATENTSTLANNLSVRVSLHSAYDYWNNTNFSTIKYTPFTPTFSDVNSPARKSWQPYSGPEFYKYSEAILADILSKREYLYRHYFSNKGFKSILPDHFRAIPNHPLLTELRDLSPFIDSVMLSSEITRDMTYYRSSLFNTSLVHTLFSNFNYGTNGLPLNINFINNYFLTYLTSNASVNNLSNDYELLRNQYRPMRKGVSNMVKLHATGAVAMPIETRLHILASSKDVIHSWAIPSAGIKIDCVPGYSSHRIMIFLVSGIFWGQCMEICGRFHHWMPIIVFFLKRDLFFLWCTHFMHFSPSTNDFNMSDRQLCDSLKPATFSQSSWVSDINSNI